MLAATFQGGQKFLFVRLNDKAGLKQRNKVSFQDILFQVTCTGCPLQNFILLSFSSRHFFPLWNLWALPVGREAVLQKKKKKRLFYSLLNRGGGCSYLGRSERSLGSWGWFLFPPVSPESPPHAQLQTLPLHCPIPASPSPGLCSPPVSRSCVKPECS